MNDDHDYRWKKKAHKKKKQKESLYIPNLIQNKEFIQPDHKVLKSVMLLTNQDNNKIYRVKYRKTKQVSSGDFSESAPLILLLLLLLLPLLLPLLLLPLL